MLRCRTAQIGREAFRLRIQGNEDLVWNHRDGRDCRPWRHWLENLNRARRRVVTRRGDGRPSRRPCGFARQRACVQGERLRHTDQDENKRRDAREHPGPYSTAWLCTATATVTVFWPLVSM